MSGCSNCPSAIRETVDLVCQECGRDYSDTWTEMRDDLRPLITVAVQRVILDALMRAEMPDDSAIIDGVLDAVVAAGYRRFR